MIKITTRSLDQNPADFQGSSDGSKTPCGADQKSVHDLPRKQEKKERTRNPGSRGKNYGRTNPIQVRKQEFQRRTRNLKAKEERKEQRTRNPKAKERKEHRTRNPKAKERERIPRERESKSYTEIPASERCKNDFAKKAEKLAKEETEMKKKVSIKNGKKSVHFMTPMVKI